MLSSTTSASSLPLFPDIGTTTTQVLAGQATTGACKGDCQMLIPFMLLLLVICFLMAGLKTPIATVTMRCVEDDLRSFSLGIQMVILRTLALLPAPIIFGNIIDTTCLWWKYECGSRKNCLLYDVESYRYKYAGICTGLHLLGLMTFVITWYIVRKQEKRELLQQRHDINKPVEAKARFYMNEEGECSLQSLTGTEITTVGPPTPT